MKHVFLIDDDLDDREIFQTALQSLETETTFVQARDGQEGLDLIAKPDFKMPDLIFADLNMPKVNGLEFLTAVRKIPMYAQVPVFIYSTSSVKEECDKCLAAGASGFIIKHSSFDALCSDLKKIIEEKTE
jgi:CheY-like chemotaxis protein